MKLSNLNRLPTRFRSRRSEKDLARLVGGKVQPASGALPVSAFKGDVVTRRFMFDDKRTAANSYGLTVKLWRKTAEDALGQGREPVLRISFAAGANLYVMDEQTFLRLLESNATEQGSDNNYQPIKFPLRKKRNAH